MTTDIKLTPSSVAAITHCEECGCDWLDNGLNPVGCPYCKQSADAKILVAERDALEAENERLRAEIERLQEIVRPKREDECLTLDHWRMRAYALEENWSRCSRACAVEQTKREQAEAHIKRLEEALREAITMLLSDYPETAKRLRAVLRDQEEGK